MANMSNSLYGGKRMISLKDKLNTQRREEAAQVLEGIHLHVRAKVCVHDAKDASMETIEHLRSVVKTGIWGTSLNVVQVPVSFKQKTRPWDVQLEVGGPVLICVSRKIGSAVVARGRDFGKIGELEVKDDQSKG